MDHIRIVPSEAQHLPHHARGWYRPEGMKRTHSRSSSSSVRPPAYVCPTPRRSHTTACHDPCEPPRDPPLWPHMAKTYAWVLEQEIADMARRNEETVRWILKQQERDMREHLMSAVWNMESRYWDLRESLEEGEEFRRKPRGAGHAFRDAPHTDIYAAVEEEIRRLQGRRHEAEKCREAYGRRKVLEEQRERERRKQRQERGKAEREVAEKAAWKAYESRWDAINANEPADEELTFETLPWPQVAPPRTVEDIRGTRIAMFLLSSQHSSELSKKERIRAALRRWHPDRFGRILARVREEDRAKVEEGAGVVARCLNNMLERAA